MKDYETFNLFTVWEEFMKKLLFVTATAVLVVALTWSFSYAQSPMPADGPVITFCSNVPEPPVGKIENGDLLSLSLAMNKSNKNQKYALYIGEGNYAVFYPDWDIDSPANMTQYLQDSVNPEAIGVVAENILCVHFKAYHMGDATFTAVLFDQQLGADKWVQVGDPATYTWRFDAEEPEHPCRNGSMIVDVTGIPSMDDGNKNSLNKTCFFCLRDETDISYIAVYHRYIQPDWPYGPWWVAWRFEAGAAGCEKEWNIWSSHPLPGNSASFLVQWNNRNVSVTHLGTGDSQNLYVDNILGIDFMYEDSECSSWGWSSAASSRSRDYDCDEVGGPTSCYEF